MATELQVPIQPSQMDPKRYGKVYTSYFAIEKRVHSRLPDNRQLVAAVRYFPQWAKRDHYRWLRELSPSADLLACAKARKISFKDYAEEYLKELTTNYDSMRQVEDLVHLILYSKMDIVLFCYEKDSSVCHRSILKQLLMDVCAGEVGQEPHVFDGGEIS